MSRIYVGRLPDPVWRSVLAHYLSRADTFRVHTPNGDGELSAGRDEFEALAGAVVRPWDGMRDAVEIAGPLTAEAAAVFTAHETSMDPDPGRKLWDYQLFVGPAEVLSIGDFADLLVDAADSEVLVRLGVRLQE